ncbi:MAG: choice-of-anchor Q domain-containing protein [Chloroflexota bacterium]
MDRKKKLSSNTKRFRFFGLILALTLGMGLVIGLRTALAKTLAPSASFSVTTTQDSSDINPGDGICDGGSGCSLRAAIEEGNALPGEDTILLPANTYSLTNGQLTITDSLVIDGEGAGTTIIDAQGNSRVFSIEQPEGKDPIQVSVLSVTVKNGRTTDRGGGIQSDATLVVRDSILRQNTAMYGGGISTVTGTLTIANSAVVSNTSQQDGSGIYTSNSIVTVTNVTLHGNTASEGHGGGVYSEASELSLVNATLSSNTAAHTGGEGGGGIYIHAGTVRAVNTIIAGNTDQSPANQHPDCSGVLVSNGHNLVQDVDGCTLNGVLTGVLTDTAPLLGPLADNGGETFTQALLKDSPAINHADPADCPAADQRNFTRRSGYCDLGAFEAQPAELDALSGSGQRTLIETAFALPLQALAQDQYGNPLAGVGLVFKGPASGAGISNDGQEQKTNASGIASFTPVANGTQGSYTVTASIDGLATAYHLTNLFSSTTTIVSDFPDPSSTGEMFTISFTVTSTYGTPGGSVTLTVLDRSETCQGELLNGTGQCALNIPTTGQYTLLASYNGSDRFAGSEDSETHTVNVKVFLPTTMRNHMPASIFGIEFKNIAPSGGLAQISAARPTWVRKNGVTWSSVSPNNATERQWSSLAALETELRNAASNHMEAILVVRSTPTWAQKRPGFFCGPIKSDALDEFAAFLGDLVSRYSVAPYNVKYWEIWNEPDVDPALVPGNAPYGCWGDSNDPYYGGEGYAEMLKVAYPAIKDADPNAQVLVGGLLLDCDPHNPPAGKSCTSSKFLEGVLKANGGPYFDGISFHAYDYYGGTLGQYSNANWYSAWNTIGTSTAAKTDYIRALLEQYAVSGKFLMNTETSILCDNCVNDTSYEQTKAYYLAQSYAVALSKGLMANIWYSATGWRTSGLLDESLTPVPAYHAYAFARREVGNAAFVSPVFNHQLDADAAADVVAYAFTQGNKQIWLIWSLDGGAYTLALPSAPSAAYDVFGNALAVSGDTFAVGIAPVYLEWTK